MSMNVIYHTWLIGKIIYAHFRPLDATNGEKGSQCVNEGQDLVPT